MKIGVVYTDNSASASSIGAGSNPYTINQRSAMDALVAGVNATGGIAGRRLDAVGFTFDASSSNYSGAASQACSTFTQDNHVPVVLDTSFGSIAGFRDCLRKAGVLDIVAATEGDTGASHRNDLHVNVATMTTDRTYGAVVSGLVRSGYLSRRNQLGVVVEGCPEDTLAYRNTIAPLIARLGLAAPVEASIDCTTGFSSAGAAAAALSNAVLKFRTRGVDRVMFISGEESAALLLFANAASSQGFTPGYTLSSTSVPGVLRAELPRDQWPGLNGVGTQPTVDVESRQEPLPAEQRCLLLLRASGAGLNPSTNADIHFVYQACGPLLLLSQALTSTGGSSVPDELMASINGLGSSFRAPGIVDGRTHLSVRVHDAPSAVRVFGYNAACTCIRYRGSILAAPE